MLGSAPFSRPSLAVTYHRHGVRRQPGAAAIRQRHVQPVVALLQHQQLGAGVQGGW